ncbi:MAG: ABC transporter permease subunit [Dehalococcoidia bacterium]
MLSNVFLKTLWDHWRATMWFCVGLIALSLYTSLFYPSISGVSELEDFLAQLPEALVALFGGITDLATPEGFFNTQIFYFMAPLILIVYAVTRGATAIAGEEANGTLDQLLSNPVSRTRVVIQKAAAMAVGVTALGVALWAGLTAGTFIADIELSLVRLAAICFSVALMALAMGLLALAIGASTGRQTMSMALAGVVAIVSYLLHAFQELVDFLEPARFVSVFYYALGNEPLKNGLSLAHVLILVGIALVALTVAVVGLERRDLQG